jgi:peptidoglycan/LPS O-acetylase OafA/YrhL
VRLGHRPALDGLRAVAVLLVIAIHVGLLAGGYIGVDVFLALSGFLITALLCQEWDRTGEISLRRFYKRRVVRLFPALLLLVTGFALVMVVLEPFPSTWPLGRLIATTLLFANNWVATLAPQHGSVLGALSPTWTLAQEGQFYLLWPPLLWALLRLRARPRVILAVLVVAILALVAADPLLAHRDAAYNSYTSPFDRGAELLLGAAAAIVWRERLVPRLLRHPAVGWAAAAGIAVVLVYADATAPRWYLTTAVLSALLIVNLLSQPAARPGLFTVSGAQRALEGVLGSRPLAYAGKVSYGIYLYHVPLYYLLYSYLPIDAPALRFPIVAALSFLAAAASWALVESPVIHGLRNAGLFRVPVVQVWTERVLALRGAKPVESQATA